MELNQMRIEDAIVAEVADRMIGDDELRGRVKTAVNSRIDRLFSESADAQIRAAVETSIANGFEHEYCRVNSFGQREGQTTTIRAELEKLIAGYWNERVDRDGKPSSSSYDAKITRAEWLMTKMVAADFHGEMKQHVVNIGGALKDKLRLELHRTVNDLLAGVFHVRSADDQAVNRRDSSIIEPSQKLP